MLYEDDMCHPLNQECEPVISSRLENNKKVKKNHRLPIERKAEA